MKSKIAGFPLVLVILAVLIILPLGYEIAVVGGAVQRTHEDVLQTRIAALRCSRLEPTATVTVQPTVSPTGNPLQIQRTRPATSAGSVK